MDINRLSKQWHDITNSSQILGDQRRDSKPSDELAQPGYVGSQYNGILLMGMNPGAGGTSETQQNNSIYKTLNDLKNGTDHSQAFNHLNMAIANAAPTWKIYRNLISHILDAMDTTLDQISWLNIVKWRNAPKVQVRRFYDQGWREHTEKQVDILQPTHIIALGVGTGNRLNRLYRGNATITIIPRVIGDSSLSEKTKIAIERLRQPIK